jgi:hypothetical protein
MTMKNILRALLFGVVVGVLLGVQFNERGRKRMEQEAADATLNNPEVIKLFALSRRLKQADKWIDDIEENLDDA